MPGKQYPADKVKFTPFQYLMAANEMAEKYDLSNLAVRKVAAWILHEASSGIRGNNPCNMRCSNLDNDFYMHPGKVWEIINGKKVFADPNNPNDPIRKFRYYKTLGEGLESLLSWLVRLHQPALKTLLDDDKSAYDFGMVLGTLNSKHQLFYTGDQKQYAAALEYHYQTMAKLG
jgi:hypothetical protein